MDTQRTRVMAEDDSAEQRGWVPRLARKDSTPPMNTPHGLTQDAETLETIFADKAVGAHRGPAATRTRRMLRFARSNATAVTVGLALLLGIGDFATGVETTFTLLYLVPVGLAAWWRGRALAFAVAALCISSAVGTELVKHLEHQRPLHPFRMAWNHGGSFLIFVIVALLVVRVRASTERDRRERRLTVEQLRQAERLGVIGRMAAGIAHELGTPLNVISGHAEMLDSNRVNPSMVHAASTAILVQTERMTTLIRGLLDFSRRAGRERSGVDLGELALRVAGMLRPIGAKNGVEIEVASEVNAVVSGNPVELEQVLVNLMVNAIQAMPAGGTLRVRIRDRVRQPSSLGSSPPPPMACVEVTDEGIGIAPESLEKVFDPFYTTRDVGEGTGLGLSVSYGIVADHGGRIEVESVLGSGSRFSVYLPRAEKSA